MVPVIGTCARLGAAGRAVGDHKPARLAELERAAAVEAGGNGLRGDVGDGERGLRIEPAPAGVGLADAVAAPAAR